MPRDYKNNTVEDLPEIERFTHRHRHKRRPCGKRRLYSKDAAREALSSAASKNKLKRKESRFYWCPICRAYHLSSQPRRKNANGG